MYTYSDAVNDQGAIVKRLHSEGADQSLSVPEPANDRAGVSVDWAVEHGRAALDGSLRHAGFTLQHWRLCRQGICIMKMSAENCMICPDRKAHL